MRFHACVRFLFLSLALRCAVSHPTKPEDDGVKPALVERKEVPEGDEMFRTTMEAKRPSEGMAVEEEPDVEKELTALLDRVEGASSMELVPGVAVLEKVEATREGRTLEAAPGASLGDRLKAFLETHVLKLKLPGFENVEEGRGRLKRLLVPFVVLMKMVEATVLSVFMSGIAFISLKGLWSALAAALVAGAVGLRELLLSSGWGPHAPRVTVLRPHVPHVPVEHVYHGADYLHHGWSRTAPVPGAAASAASAAAASLALDPYRGYGPTSGVVSPAASAWDSHPVLH